MARSSELNNRDVVVLIREGDILKARLLLQHYLLVR